MAEDPAKRTRNLFWLAMQQLYGLSAAEIANHEKVATRTVQAGIRDALGYAQPGRRAVDGDDQAEPRIMTLAEARGRNLQYA